MSGELSRASTTERVADVLRDRIAIGEVEPGARLIELEIARELGVSRSPVREALLRLSEEGLVEMVPYRGAIVVPLRRKRLQDLLDVRLALERFAIVRLCQASAPDAIEALRSHVERIAAALQRGDARAAVAADLAMHRALVALTDNAVLLRSFDGLLNQFRLYIRVTSKHYRRAEDLADEHRGLLAAIRDGNAVRAQEILDAHIRHGLDEALVALPPENLSSASD